MLHTIIIEDEISAKEHLNKLISNNHKDIKVIKILSSVSDSIDWLKNNKHPDIIFMDIHLSDGISFDILEEVNIESLIIYTTAYDEYALRAFKTNSIDYLLKPITEDDLNNAITKYQYYSTRHYEELAIKNIEYLHQLKPDKSYDYKNRFLLKKGKSIIPVKIDDIAYFFRDEIVFANCFDGISYSMDESLNQLQKKIDPKHFLRINRQLLVNTDAIKRLIPFKPGQLQVLLAPEFHEPIYLSQERSSLLKKSLGK